MTKRDGPRSISGRKSDTFSAKQDLAPAQPDDDDDDDEKSVSIRKISSHRWSQSKLWFVGREMSGFGNVKQTICSSKSAPSMCRSPAAEQTAAVAPSFKISRGTQVKSVLPQLDQTELAQAVERRSLRKSTPGPPVPPKPIRTRAALLKPIKKPSLPPKPVNKPRSALLTISNSSTIAHRTQVSSFRP